MRRPSAPLAMMIALALTACQSDENAATSVDDVVTSPGSDAAPERLDGGEVITPDPDAAPERLDGEVIPPDPDATPERPDGGEVITPTPEPQREVERQRLLSLIADDADLSADELLARYAPTFGALGFDPLQAENLDLIQGGPLALTEGELAILGREGFVIRGESWFPTFAYGYETLYMADLPLYVSADSLLYALHRSYDDILKSLELSALIPDLEEMLGQMRTELAAGAADDFGAGAKADVDMYLSVALSLLVGEVAAPTAGGDAEEIAALYEGAVAHEGMQMITLFGVARRVDFSQFEPRGHYNDDDLEILQRYFRAMIWLGRVDLRLIETLEDHSQVFHRRQLEAALAIRAVMNRDAVARWGNLDRAIEAFVGESDNMVLSELDALMADLGAQGPETYAATLAGVDDAAAAQAILSGGYGAQRISSHIMINGTGEGTMPLSSTFLLLGQRYVLDSHVFSNVVYDRANNGAPWRMMPNPLDVAFAALANDQAAQLLEPALRAYEYAPDLSAMRVLADAHPPEFWQANLYNLWLGALRALSPSDELADPAAVGLPAVATTEAWGRRLLNTQLASWAELRHDTILYVKQSYTSGAECEFPDAYVDPYPEFYGALQEIALRGQAVVERLDFGRNASVATSVTGYLTTLHEVSGILREMAERQRRGEPFSEAQMAFINQAVHIQMGCGGAEGVDGWYAQLFFNNESAIEFDPTTADVHTQPTDEGGVPVGRVLHVSTGGARLMVVTVDTCEGPRAYAGLASSYFERVTDNFERMDDDQWAIEIGWGWIPEDVPWMTGLIAR